MSRKSTKRKTDALTQTKKKTETQFLKKVQEHKGSKEASSDRGGGGEKKRNAKKLGRRELEGGRGRS
jgi:hypothetical protein